MISEAKKIDSLIRRAERLTDIAGKQERGEQLTASDKRFVMGARNYKMLARVEGISVDGT